MNVKVDCPLHLHKRETTSIHLFFMGRNPRKIENYCTEGARTSQATEAPLTYSW